MDSPLNTAQHHFEKALELYNKGLLDEAAERFRLAIKMRDGNFPRAHYFLGHALLNAGDTTGALDAFNQAIKQQPENPDAYYHLGSALARTGNHPAAIQAFSQAIKQRSGNHSWAHHDLG